MLASLWIYRPFITLLNGSALLILRLLGAPYQAHRHIHSPDEIELLIAESRDGGLLEPDEHRRLQRALRLNLRQAKPADGAAASESPRSASTRRSTKSSASSRRVRSRGCPSIATRIDNIVGILHTKDLVRWFVEGSPGDDARRSDPRDAHGARERDRRSRPARPSRAALASGAGRRRVRRHVGPADAGGRAVRAARSRRRRIQGRASPRLNRLPTVEPDCRARWVSTMRRRLLDTTWDTDASTVGGLVIEALGHIPPARDRRHRSTRVRGRAGGGSHPAIGRRQARGPGPVGGRAVMEILVPIAIISVPRPGQRTVRRRRVRHRRRAAREHRAPGLTGQPAGATRAAHSRGSGSPGSLHRDDADRHLGRESRARHVRRALAGRTDSAVVRPPRDARVDRRSHRRQRHRRRQCSPTCTS